ncbi:hypothetical protein HDU76_011460 [Blyttiomyces sp. JEL0837]|nr:hypothetical protein HDU76_011460 [Blyttiomyces sp. JEL0837]
MIVEESQDWDFDVELPADSRFQKELIAKFINLRSPTFSSELEECLSVAGIIEALVNMAAQGDSVEVKSDYAIGKISPDERTARAALILASCKNETAVAESLIRLFDQGLSKPASIVFKTVMPRNDVVCQLLLSSICKQEVSNVSELWSNAISIPIVRDQLVRMIFESDTKLKVKLDVSKLFDFTLSCLITEENALESASELLSRLVERAYEQNTAVFFRTIISDPDLLSPIFFALENPVSDEQYLNAITNLHVFAIKTSGRCPLVPTARPYRDHHLLDVKRHVLTQIRIRMESICSLNSRTFKKRHRGGVPPSNNLRLMVLEMVVEAISDVCNSSESEVSSYQAELEHALSVLPWNVFIDWYFFRYRQATIFKNLLYSLFTLPISCKSRTVLHMLLRRENECGCDLLAKLDAQFAESGLNVRLCEMLKIVADNTEAQELKSLFTLSESWASIISKLTLCRSSSLFPDADKGRVIAVPLVPRPIWRAFQR